MDTRRTLIALGAGITVGLVVSVLVIEALSFEFSAIVAIPCGLLAGVGTVVGITRRYDIVDERVRALFDGSAGFGYTVVVLLALRYVGRLGLRALLTFERVLGAAVVVAVASAAVSWVVTRSQDSGR